MANLLFFLPAMYMFFLPDLQNVICFTQPGLWVKKFTSKSTQVFMRPNSRQSSVNDKIQYYELKIITKPLKYTNISTKYFTQGIVMHFQELYTKKTAYYGP